MGRWGWVGVSGGIFWVVGGGWTFFMGGWGVGGHFLWVSGGGWGWVGVSGGIFWVDGGGWG